MSKQEYRQILTSAITSADEQLICEWANCREASVDSDGDVWIADPQTGHWLSNEDKHRFKVWRKDREQV